MNWISVTEQLPQGDLNSSTHCLVYAKNYSICVRPYNHYHECWDTEDGDDHYSEPIGGKVTHWMPLPEPPKQ